MLEDEDYDSDDTWESDLESEAEIAEIMQLDIAEDSSTSGKKEYLAKCSELKIVPVAMFIAKLDCEHINLRHHGMGVKGALAISAALFVNTQIRSLNLGDNWLRDDGTHAMAQVHPFQSSCLFPGFLHPTYPTLPTFPAFPTCYCLSDFRAGLQQQHRANLDQPLRQPHRAARSDVALSQPAGTQCTS